MGLTVEATGSELTGGVGTSIGWAGPDAGGASVTGLKEESEAGDEEKRPRGWDRLSKLKLWREEGEGGWGRNIEHREYRGLKFHMMG